jgi:flavodoxin
MECLLVLFSYHHHNTEKVAKVLADALDAQIKRPQQVDPETLPEYDLVGFGSGIYGGELHKAVLKLADQAPQVSGRKAFIFSTSTNTWDVAGNHASLREKLEAKGYTILGDFNCAGFNTNSFIRFFGGVGRGRPNAQDLARAREFAEGLKLGMQRS